MIGSEKCLAANCPAVQALVALGLDVKTINADAQAARFGMESYCSTDAARQPGQCGSDPTTVHVLRALAQGMQRFAAMHTRATLDLEKPSEQPQDA